MSDSLGFAPEELDRIIELGKLRDTRFATLGFSISVENELTNSAVIKAIMQAIRTDADAAMEAMADTSPADQVSMTLHLVKIQTLVYIRRVLQAVLNAGKVAQAAIVSEDQAEGAYERDD